MKHQFLLLLLCLFVAFGCEDKVEPMPEHAEQKIELDQTFSLVPPQKAYADRLKVQVLEINDSRCPPGLQCIWEGEVVVKLGIQIAGKSEEAVLTLHRPEQDGKNVKVVGDYRITLEWVSQHEPSTGTDLGDFEVRLTVSKV